MLSARVAVVVVSMLVLSGCASVLGIDPPTLVSELDTEGGSPSADVDGGEREDAESPSAEAAAVDSVDSGDVAVDAGREAAARVVEDAEAPREDAGDAGSAPKVNAFPGSPYGPATCRGGADCSGDDAGAQVCLANEAVSSNGGAGILTGQTTCRPAEGFFGPPSVVLCLSDLDCSGYPCVAQTCEVSVYAPYDAGDISDVVGTTNVAVSYCQSPSSTPPLGCN
jgi:hypothetical protein